MKQIYKNSKHFIEVCENNVTSEELEYLKTMPHSQFQGYYDTNTGQLFTSMDQWKAYVEEAVQYDENLEDLEDYEDYALVVNNPNALIIDPTYEYYAVKRQEQIDKVQKQIDRLKSKERLEGINSAKKRFIWTPF